MKRTNINASSHMEKLSFKYTRQIDHPLGTTKHTLRLFVRENQTLITTRNENESHSNVENNVFQLSGKHNVADAITKDNMENKCMREISQ